MKLKVISAFRDKDDHVTVYDPDSILEVKDEERARSLIERGLCQEFKGKAAPAYILGKEEDGEAEESGESGQSGQSDGSGQSDESGQSGESGQSDGSGGGGDKPVERLNPEDDE